MPDDDWDLVDDMLLFDDDEDPLADLDDDPLDDPSDVDHLDVEVAVDEPEIGPAPARPRPPPRKGLLRRIFGI